MNQRFCQDCDHYRVGDPFHSGLDTCAHPSLPEKRDRVRGELLPHYCNSVRGYADPCGPDAKLFEPKNSNNG